MPELAVVCALTGIVAALALPSYAGHLRQSRRTDAVDALVRLQAAQEAHRATHGVYAASLSALGRPESSLHGHYTVELQPSGTEAYRARALATGSQAADGACAALTLVVQRGFAQSGPDARCWNR